MKKTKRYFLIITITLLLYGCFNSVTEFDYSFKKTTERSGATSWIFKGEYKPPINLKNDNNFISDVNVVLTKIDLPQINNRVIEKEKITGSRVHRTIFEWSDYPLGILQVKRSTDKDANYDGYDCIWKVTLIEK